MMKESFFWLILFVALMFAGASIPAYAQNGGAKVTVVLADSKTGAPIGFATVSLKEKGVEKAYKYILSNAEGRAEISGVKNGTFNLKAEIMGYKSYETTVTIKDRKSVDLGTVKMSEDIQTLDAAGVSAVGNPIIVKKDTIEYNASSFKTTDNDMLEELLKKLPGVEVGTDGTITANGETIKKITIDGKTFFLDDPQLASKNIPAKMIEKVKVVEKKSEQAEFTGIDDGNEETIIDLSIRPGMMNGWFGNIMGGGGHDLQQTWADGDWRYQGTAMVGRFTQKSQISFIANGNNTNNRGFNDTAGSMMSSMRGAGVGRVRSSGGWGNDSGITTSWMGGLNGAWTLLDDNMQLGGNYLYSGSQKSLLEKSEKITYLDNGDQLIYNNGGPESYGRNSGYGYNNTNTGGHRFGIRLEHKFSENTSIIFEPQVNFGSGNYGSYSDFTTDRLNSTTGELTKNNSGFNSSQGHNNNWSTSGFFLFRQRLGIPGRTLSAHIRYSFSGNSLTDGLNQSLTSNYENGALKNEDIVNQRIDRVQNGQSVDTRISYTEPLGHSLYLEAAYSYSWSRNYSNKNAYNSGVVDGFTSDYHPYNRDGETIDETYSSRITNISQNHNGGFNLQYQKDKLRFQIGAAVQPTTTRNATKTKNQIDTTYTVWNWSPRAMFRYEFTDNSDIMFFYSGNSGQPSTSQLMPVPDNSNPLDVSFGNPYLKPYFSHSLRGHFGYTNKKTFFSVRGRFSAGMVQNPITNAVWYEDNGAQYNMPLNGPVSGNAGLDFFLNTPIAKSNFSISNFFRASFNQSASYIGKDTFNTGDYYDSENAEFNYDKFNADFFNHSSEISSHLNLSDYFSTNTIQNVSFTERITFKYSCDLVEVNVGGRTSYNKSWYTVQTSQKARWNNQVNASMNWTIPGGINLSSNLNYNWYCGYSTPQQDEFVWNAELSKLLFKNKFTLALKAYDILNQSKNLSISDAANYHQEIRNNTLGRYIILSLTYRFGNFGKAGKAIGMDRGPGGPPPHHR